MRAIDRCTRDQSAVGSSPSTPAQRCRRLLAAELGVDPSPQTRELHLRVVRGWRSQPGRTAPAPARPTG